MNPDNYYLALAGDTPNYPTLNDLQPIIEVIHHACSAEAYDEAFQVFRVHIQQDRRAILIHQLGAYETNLALMLEFFPNGDTTQYLPVSNPQAKRFILNEIGLCLMCLGRLSAAVPFYERSNDIMTLT